MREEHKGYNPVHVTLRARGELGSLRRWFVFAEIEGAIAKAHKEDFRVLHFSAQDDHIHLNRRGEGWDALSSGVHGLTVRLAYAINRGLKRRGNVWADRAHTTELKNPTMVRNALIYVLMNFKKH